MTVITVNAAAIKGFTIHGVREPVFDVAAELGAPGSGMVEAVVDGPLRMRQCETEDAAGGHLVYLETKSHVQEVDTSRLPVLRKPVIIHVNRQNIAMNRRDGRNRPCFTAKFPGHPARYSSNIHVTGTSRLVFNGQQLRCGAYAWLETDAPVRLDDPVSFAEARVTV